MNIKRSSKMVKILKNDGSRGTKNLPDASIPPGTVFTGDIDTAGGIRIDGTVKGKVRAGGDVTIGLEGTVEGGIKSSNVNIAGKIIGNVSVSGAVQMLSGSKLVGDLAASSFAIELGAYYKGQCIITGSKEQPMLSAPKEEAEPDKSRSEAAEPDKSSRSEAAEPEAAEPIANESEAGESDAGKPEANESDTVEPDETEPRNNSSEAAASDLEQKAQNKSNAARTPNNRRKNRKR
jgi:cytoskeletal protein CcmA (bactofilin family)